MITNDGKYELSLYKEDELTKRNLVECTIKVRNAFPSLTPDFFDVFAERIKDRKFSDKKLIDAVNHVIDNCVYPTPTIAQFLSYDKRVRLYTWTEVADMTKNDPNAFSHYLAVKIDGVSKPMYAYKNDIELYNLETWKK